MQRFAWYIMTLLAIGTGGYALLNVASPDFRPLFVANIFANTPLAANLHMGFGMLAMITGPFQFIKSWRQRRIHVHRWTGRVYVLSVVLSGISGFYLAWHSVSIMATQVGFAMMASVWLITTVMALKSVLQGNIEAHRCWMIRSYALTLAGVTLRIYLGLSFAAGIPFADFYPVLAWICWIPNLIVVDWWMSAQTKQRTAGLNE